MKNIHLILGSVCFAFLIMDILADAHPLVTIIAAVATITNVISYFTR